MDNREKGKKGEDRALSYLLERGFHLKARNFRVREGEIDLVMEKDDALYFVEVKYREQQKYGGAIESITEKKRETLATVGCAYLSRYAVPETTAYYFSGVFIDVIRGEERVEFIKDIFL